MAYKAIGVVYKVGATQTVQTKNGSQFQRRTLILLQKRYDQNTGEEFEPNYVPFDFSQKHCSDLDGYRAGDTVTIQFDASGSKYNDKLTGEEKVFVSLRAFRIERFQRQQQGAQSQQNLQAPPQNMFGNGGSVDPLPY